MKNSINPNLVPFLDQIQTQFEYQQFLYHYSFLSCINKMDYVYKYTSKQE